MQSQPQSPSRAGMLNKIKKKLSKGRKGDLSSSLNEDSDSDAQNSKFDIIDKIEKLDTLLQGEKSPNLFKEMRENTPVNSPKRQNLIEKDTNTVNTYTKDPTKEHKNTASLKDTKGNAKLNGPILYINNTYDLPPFVSPKKGSGLDGNSNVDGSNSDNSIIEHCERKQNTLTSEENKENSKTKGRGKSPFRNKRERGSKDRANNSRSSSRNRNENSFVSRSNSSSKTERLQTGIKSNNNSTSDGNNTDSQKDKVKSDLVKSGEALKNASAVIANSKDSEDSDDYYITCELPGPGAVIAKLNDPNQVPIEQFEPPSKVHKPTDKNENFPGLNRKGSNSKNVAKTPSTASTDVHVTVPSSLAMVNQNKKSHQKESCLHEGIASNKTVALSTFANPKNIANSGQSSNITKGTSEKQNVNQNVTVAKEKQPNKPPVLRSLKKQPPPPPPRVDSICTSPVSQSTSKLASIHAAGLQPVTKVSPVHAAPTTDQVSDKTGLQTSSGSAGKINDTAIYNTRASAGQKEQNCIESIKGPGEKDLKHNKGVFKGTSSGGKGDCEYKSTSQVLCGAVKKKCDGQTGESGVGNKSNPSSICGSSKQTGDATQNVAFAKMDSVKQYEQSNTNVQTKPQTKVCNPPIFKPLPRGIVSASPGKGQSQNRKSSAEKPIVPPKSKTVLNKSKNEQKNNKDKAECIKDKQRIPSSHSSEGHKSDKYSVKNDTVSRPVATSASSQIVAGDNRIKEVQQMAGNLREEKGPGYSSLADVQRYFSISRNQKVSSSNPMNSGQLKNVKSDDNGNSAPRDIKTVIKCDVNIHGGKVTGALTRRQNVPLNRANSDVTTPKPDTPKKNEPKNPTEGYTTLDDFLGSSASSTKPKDTTSSMAKMLFENKGARPKQRSIQFEKGDTRRTTATIPQPSTKATQLDVNLNLAYQRETSHESGYETSGSGFRSHSSSSNEYLQHDLSNYSLLSECTEDGLKRTSTASDSTSDHDEVYRETIEQKTPAEKKTISNMYAYVPKSPKPPSSTQSDDDELRITSPDSVKQEGTLVEASSDEEDIDSGHELTADEQDDDDNDEDESHDYLPPIPTRNYDSDDKTSDESTSKSAPNRDSMASSGADSDVLDGLHIDEIVAEYKAKNAQKASVDQTNEVTIDSKTIFDKTEKSEADLDSSEKTDEDKTKQETKGSKPCETLKIEIETEANKKDKISPSKLQEVKKLLYSPLHKARSGMKGRKSDTEKTKRSCASLHDKVLSKESIGSQRSVPDKVNSESKPELNTASNHPKQSSESTPSVRKRCTVYSPEKFSSKVSDTASEVYNHGSFSSDSTASLDQSFWASFDEPVHMSWDEVTSQANELGIPLSAIGKSRMSGFSGGAVSGNSKQESPVRKVTTTQTLHFPKHSSDKMRKFGTLKDKFASLFSRRNVDRNMPTIQNRMLPLPPGRHSNHDAVDGSSPTKIHSMHPFKSQPCQIHGSSPRSPLRQHSTGSTSCKCSHCSHSNRDIRMTQSYHQGSQCTCACSSQSSVAESCHSNTSWHSSHSNHSSTMGSANKGRCCHRISDSSIHENRRPETCMTLDRRSGGSPLYPKAYPVHDSSPSGNHASCCHSSGASPTNCCQHSRHSHHSQSTTNRRTRSESHDTHRRDRSQSRDAVSRSKSPHVPSHVYPRPSQCQGQCCFHGPSESPSRQTRSCSSSGIVQRCPPSPAPSSATSIMSAPSAFGPTSRSRDHSPAPPRGECCQHDAANADFIGSLSKLKDVGWYWGPLGWDEAEAKLATKPDGSFIVRDSSDDRYILSLSFRSQGATHHTRIEHYKGMFSFYSQPKSHGAATIIEFIEKAMEHSRSGKFLYFLRPRAPGLPPAPVQLLLPISRFRTMQTLQHCCRFEILKHVRKDHISNLPVPQKIKDYLEESQYYIETLGDG